jgi:hypothetical protein
VPSKRTPLHVRHEVALKLLARGELELSLVCWPRKGSRLEDVPTERRYYSEDLKAEIRARHAAGESVPELALKTGIPFGQVKFMCSGERAARPHPAELTLF